MNSIMNKSLKNTLYYCLGILLIAVILQLLSVSSNKELFLPGINVIIKDLFYLLGKSSTYISLWNTIKNLLLSLGISIIIGCTLGIIAGINKNLYLLFKPAISFLKTLPVIIFIVLLMLFFKFKNVPIITCVLILVPIFYEGTYQGIINLDRSYLDVYRLNSKTTPFVLFKVHLPLISSYSKASFISSIGMGIKILVTTEYICGVNDTIGKQIIEAMNNLEYSYIYAYSIILIIMILFIESLPNLIIKTYKLTLSILKK